MSLKDWAKGKATPAFGGKKAPPFGAKDGGAGDSGDSGDSAAAGDVDHTALAKEAFKKGDPAQAKMHLANAKKAAKG